MKTLRIDLQDLAAQDNLVLASWKAARGKRHRGAVARFLANLDQELEKLAQSIRTGMAPLGDARRFVIHDPKRRVITAVSFPDRVLHHAILNLAEPRFERIAVDSSFACRPGKGVHRAVMAVQRQLRRRPWFVQVDVDSYFPSIDHAVLKMLLARRFRGAEFLDLLGRIVDSGVDGSAGCGLPIGALTSQHFANAYLDAADRRLLAHPAVHGHVRYMDDIVWWCESREAATDTLEDLRSFLWRERRLCLKPNAHIGRSRQGLAFCGFRIRPGVVFASSRKLSRYRAGLQRIETALHQGSVSQGQAQRAHDAMLATLAGACTQGFRTRLQVTTAGDKTLGQAYAD